ncbi:MAG: UDP-N-acetylenolpyruvoylglucosamine reductase, partial [Ginsengibacter sp.]
MQVHQNFSLKQYNTFRINAYTNYFAKFGSVEELRIILENMRNDLSKMILGGGSNILFTGDYD